MPRAATGSYSFVWTLLLFVGCDLQSDHGGENDPSDATFVGRQDCASCHEREDSLWQGSHHDLAMDRADESTVLGDFDNATHDYYGVTSTFYRKGDEFFVRTDGPSGALEDFRISYTFGAHPLQQYLIEFPGGRYQALNVCWDTRPADDGGQRWFHLYPDEKIDHDDILHWTGPYQNWNHMCAECHSTGLEKGYDADEKRYETTWSEIDVSCEACHGPGSTHVAWGDAKESGKSVSTADDMGLADRKSVG